MVVVYDNLIMVEKELMLKGEGVMLRG